MGKIIIINKIPIPKNIARHFFQPSISPVTIRGLLPSSTSIDSINWSSVATWRGKSPALQQTLADLVDGKQICGMFIFLFLSVADKVVALNQLIFLPSWPQHVSSSPHSRGILVACSSLCLIVYHGRELSCKAFLNSGNIQEKRSIEVPPSHNLEQRI